MIPKDIFMINNKKILCIIPARAGSIGLPGKNYRDLFGDPLFMWSVMAAEKSKYIDYVCVSSNCPYVKDIFLSYKNLSIFLRQNKKLFLQLKFVDRPDEYATSTSKNEECLIHAEKYLKEKLKINSDIIMHLQPTSPIRNNNLVDRCIEEYEKGGYDSLLTGPKDTPFIWQKINGKWEYTVDKNGCCHRKMRQDFINNEKDSEFIWHDDGNVYITDTNILLERECRLGDKVCVFETDKLQSIQVDEENDFVLIEAIAKSRKWKSLV
jgi:CMP-N,N'-diacetyllegionaminic acid synthase